MIGITRGQRTLRHHVLTTRKPTLRLVAYTRKPLEYLEPRLFLSVTHWTGLGDGVNWNDSANWDTNSIPSISDDAFITNSTTPNIMIGSQQGIHDLTCSVPVTIYGWFTLTGTATFESTLTLGYADPNSNLDYDTKIIGGTINLAAQHPVNIRNITLINTTINGDINVLAAPNMFWSDQLSSLRLAGTNIINGTMNIGSDSEVPSYHTPEEYAHQVNENALIKIIVSVEAGDGSPSVLGGHATINIGANGALYGYAIDSAIGPDVTIHDGGMLGCFRNNQGQIVVAGARTYGRITNIALNTGTITVTDEAHLYLGDFMDNQGTITLSNQGYLEINSSLAEEWYPGFTNTGSIINNNGVIKFQRVWSSTGTIQLNGGTSMIGGTYLNAVSIQTTPEAQVTYTPIEQLADRDMNVQLELIPIYESGAPMVALFWKDLALHRTFAVERSTNGYTFEQLGVVTEGNQNYPGFFTDRNVAPDSVYYYRLRFISTDMPEVTYDWLNDQYYRSAVTPQYSTIKGVATIDFMQGHYTIVELLQLLHTADNVPQAPINATNSVGTDDDNHPQIKLTKVKILPAASTTTSTKTREPGIIY